LYTYATSTPNAFHDITTGNNIVSASSCTGPRCVPVTTTSGGYSAGVGYDQVTGLGSVDAFNFVTAWHTGALLLTSTPAVTVTAGPAMLATTGSTTLTATVTSTNGFTPTGTVTFSVGSVILGTATLYGSLGTATATLTISGGAAGLITGSDTITASYGGDSSFNPATAATALTIVNPSSVAPSIAGATNAASYNQSYAPGMLLSIFGTNLALSTRSTTGSLPLPTVADNVSVTVNGVAAPFYYVSPSQLNVQIPYATPTSGKVTLLVSNNGQTASATIQMAAVAPGIFTDGNGAPVPTATAARGQNVTVYVSGAGAVTPSAATGAVPVSGTTPAPVGATVVTVGGVQASTGYVGIPSWSVGVLQINFTVPSTAPLGSQSLVVSVGGVASPAVPLTVRDN
jgi:adhesin/invasin